MAIDSFISQHICHQRLCQLSRSATFLSPAVQNLVIPSNVDHREINWENLMDVSWVSSVLSINDEHKFEPSQASQRSDKWFTEAVHRAASYFNTVHERMKRLPPENFEDLIKFCSWMKQFDTIQLCFHLWKENEGLTSHEGLMLITAALERAIGNLLFHMDKNKKVPSLLRDLLASNELRQLLDDNAIILLQILMGSPRSLNLRNLAWHGFINPGELDTNRYLSIMIFTCAIIGRHLTEHSSIHSDDIALRKWTTLPELPIWAADLRVENQTVFTDAVFKAQTLHSSRKPVLLRAFQHHRNEQYGRSCILLLPELEHQLRLIFCAVKNCPSRIITAESTIHYTTLDVILGKEEAPAMKDFLGNSIYAALLDLLVEPAGPRIRDRLSHGECLLTNIDANMSRRLLSIFLVLLEIGDDNTSSHLEYSPVFSSTVLFKRQLVTTLQDVGNWIQLVRSECGHDLLPSVELDSRLCLQLRSWLDDRSGDALHLQRSIEDLEKMNFQTVENYSFWKRILDQLSTGCKELSSCMESYRNSSELRSRQRSTYFRLVGYLPLFVRAVQGALIFPIEYVLNNENEFVNIYNVNRFRKLVVRWTDNFAGASHSCRWIKLAECAQEFLKFIYPSSEWDIMS